MRSSFDLPLGESGGVGKPPASEFIAENVSLIFLAFSPSRTVSSPATESLTASARISVGAGMAVMLETPRERTEKFGLAGVDAAAQKGEFCMTPLPLLCTAAELEGEVRERCAGETGEESTGLLS